MIQYDIMLMVFKLEILFQIQQNSSQQMFVELPLCAICYHPRGSDPLLISDSSLCLTSLSSYKNALDFFLRIKFVKKGFNAIHYSG